MKIMIWKNGHWCPFSEEEVLRLRSEGAAGSLVSPRDPRRGKRRPERPAVRRRKGS